MVIHKSFQGFPNSAVRYPEWSRRRGACQQRDRHSKFLFYLTGARYVHPVVSVLVVAQPSSEVPEGPTNYLVLHVNYLIPACCTMFSLISAPTISASILVHLQGARNFYIVFSLCVNLIRRSFTYVIKIIQKLKYKNP